tara:strand:- start:318 stop:1010 length:693 start_codon:yes stop_codon:yes gene_type:complete
MLNVICLKSGTKYSSEYVNKLYHMVERHLTIPHRFVCFTEDSEGIDSRVEIRPLPQDKSHLQGWWYKPYIFKADHFDKGDVNFYIDLDMVIVSNIDRLIDYMPDSFVGLRDVGRVYVPNLLKLGSAVLRWNAGTFSDIWNDFENNPSIVETFNGDQDWIYYFNWSNIHFFPDDWIRSYKWEIRSQSELNESRMFKEIRNPKIPKDTSILAFHGLPDVHDVKDPVIVNNWR